MTDFQIRDCDKCSGSLPAYLDYILRGVHFSGRERVEEHLAACVECSREYTDLLGMTLGEMIEPLFDQILAGEAGVGRTGLLMDYHSHWYEICTLNEDRGGAGAALSHMGLLHEIDGQDDWAFEFYKRALKQDDGSEYIRLHSAAGLGRICRKRGQWDEAKKYLKISRQAAGRLGDDFALTRSFVELGDYYSRLHTYASLARAVRYYKRAAEKGSRAGYARGLEIAQKRLVRLKCELSTFVRKLTEQYVKRFYDKELHLLGRFCDEFAARLVDEMAGSGSAISTMSVSLNESFSGARAPAILLTSLSSFLEQGETWDSSQSGRGDEKLPLLHEPVLSKLIRDVQNLGLSRDEAEELARYLQEALTRERAVEPGFMEKE